MMCLLLQPVECGELFRVLRHPYYPLSGNIW
jgi:hypothetical protein